MKSALIVVDIQNDFLPGGALAVREGDQTVAIANAAMTHFDLVVATQDWHPRQHKSFASQHSGRSPGELIELEGLPQVLWPDHCVQDSPGARFAPGLNIKRLDGVFPKGTNAAIDSYSGFYDNGRRQATGLGVWLKERQVTRVGVLGLATDYCVRFTAADALNEGFGTELILSGCRGVDLKAGDSESAVQSLKTQGALIHITLDDFVRGKARS